MTSPSVYNASLQIVRSARVATAVTQEVYVEVWRLAARYDPSEGSVLAWMMSMAHRQSVAKVRAVVDQPTSGRRAAAGSEEEVEPRLDTERARNALSALSENHRQVVVLTYFGGCSQREVAGILGLPISTVATRVRNGLIDLRNALEVEA